MPIFPKEGSNTANMQGSEHFGYGNASPNSYASPAKDTPHTTTDTHKSHDTHKDVTEEHIKTKGLPKGYDRKTTRVYENIKTGQRGFVGGKKTEEK